MIKYPEKIIKGNVYGVTATSGGVFGEGYEKRLDQAYKNLEELGYSYLETANVRTHKKLVSSDSKTRAKEFLELWKNNEVKLITQVRGGELLIDMIPYIDRETIISNKAKWVLGYSDSSLLNYYLTTNFNIATVTCENIGAYGVKPIDQSLLNIIEILENGKESIQESFTLYEKQRYPEEIRFSLPYNATEKVEYKHLYNKSKDMIEGRLIGGCIDVLFPLIGTPYDKTKEFCQQFDGMLWYLENCELSMPALYRALWQMKQSGWFKNANGFIIGRTKSQEAFDDFEYLDVLHNIFDDFNVPVIYDIDTGHLAPQWTMINGSNACFLYENGKGSIKQKMI